MEYADKNNIGSFIKQKPLVLFGTNISSEDVWVITSVDEDYYICDQFTSETILFEKDKKFHIDDIIFI